MKMNVSWTSSLSTDAILWEDLKLVEIVTHTLVPYMYTTETLKHAVVHKLFIRPINTANFTKSCNDDGNSTCDLAQPQQCLLHYKPSLHITGVIIAALIFLTTTLVVYLFACNRHLRRTPSNYLLLSLSLIDFLSGVSLAMFLLPFFYVHIAGCLKLEQNIGMPYYLACDQLVNFLFLASISHLLALSTERVISMFWAHSYEKIVSKRRILLMCCAFWISAAVISSIQLTWQRFHLSKSDEDMQKILKYDRIFSLISFVAFAVVPAIILMVQYTSMFLVIRKLMRGQASTAQTRRSLKERNILLIYCGMFVCYFLLVFPYFTLRIVIDFVDSSVWLRVPPEVPETVLMLRYLVSIGNPLLYTLCIYDFRKALYKMLKIPRLVACLDVSSASQSIGSRRTDEITLGGETEMNLIQRLPSHATSAFHGETGSNKLVSSYITGSSGAYEPAHALHESLHLSCHEDASDAV